MCLYLKSSYKHTNLFYLEFVKCSKREPNYWHHQKCQPNSAAEVKPYYICLHRWVKSYIQLKYWITRGRVFIFSLLFCFVSQAQPYMFEWVSIYQKSTNSSFLFKFVAWVTPSLSESRSSHCMSVLQDL